VRHAQGSSEDYCTIQSSGKGLMSDKVVTP
jgi:hypothetical protein